MVHSTATPLARRLQRQRQTLWLRRGLIFVMVVVIVDALFGERGLAQTIRARQEYSQTAAALSALKRENAVLREVIRRLAEDPDTIESIAREELGVIRPGELMFRLEPVR